MSRHLEALVIACCLLAAPVASTFVSSTAMAAAPAPKPSGAIVRGAILIATHPVVLRAAKLTKGSRITIVQVTSEAGVPVSVAVELKDGHVLRGVPIKLIRDNFAAAK